MQVFNTSGVFQFSEFVDPYSDPPNGIQQLWGMGGIGSNDAGTFYHELNGSLLRFMHLAE